MKRFPSLIWLLLLPGLIALSGCGGETPATTGDNPEDPAAGPTNGLPEEISDFVELDLAEYGIPMVIHVPDSTVGNPEVIEHPTGATEIRVGKKFRMEVAYDGDLAKHKEFMQIDDVYTSTVIEEKDNYIHYRSEIAGSDIKPTYHFYALVTIGQEVFEFKDVKGVDFGEGSSKRMLLSVLNAKIKEAS